MKRLLFTLCCCLLAACGPQHLTVAKYENHIDAYYAYSDISLHSYRQGKIEMHPEAVYFIGDTYQNGNIALYESLTEKYGDGGRGLLINYTEQDAGPDGMPLYANCALAVDVDSFEVTCSKAWNDELTSGKSLNGIVKLRYKSAYPPSAGGFPEHTVILSEMEPILLFGYCHIYQPKTESILGYLEFAAPPAEAGEYPVTVKMTTADGRIFEKSITLVYAAE